MEPKFWIERWDLGEIGFHQPAGNPLLKANVQHLELAPQSRIFLPLCGKTQDIPWLLSQGYRVVGAELSELAVTQLFEDLELQPTVTYSGELQRQCSGSLEVFVGDLFALNRQILGAVDGVYDRAALVALPPEMRADYCAAIKALCPTAVQLLIVFEYDQQAMAGPPFSLGDEEVHDHYGASHQLTLLVDQPVVGGLKNHCPAREKVWLLQPR